MKKLSGSLIALMFIVNICAQTISPDNQKLIESFVKNNIDIQLSDIDQIAVSKVFAGTFYKINIGYVEPGSGVTSCESAAKLFEVTLNVLCPLGADELQNVKHLRRDSQWIFLRGKFFDDFTAFIVTTAPDGAVTKIELELAFVYN